jgi:phage baseplate assembly protein W
MRLGATSLEGVALATQDLLNHFHTRKGERLGNPNFGSILPTLVFEQFTNAISAIADEEVLQIVSADPRWKLNNHVVSVNLNNQLTIELQLTYVPTMSAHTLLVAYKNTPEL